MPLQQLIYMSSPVGTPTDAEIRSILHQAQRKNAANDLTGLLLYNGMRFLQVLEGEPAVVTRTYDLIEKDERHRSVAMLLTREVPGREFAGWSMAFGDVRTSGGAMLAVQLEQSLGGASLNIQRLFQRFAEKRAA